MYKSLGHNIGLHLTCFVCFEAITVNKRVLVSYQGSYWNESVQPRLHSLFRSLPHSLSRAASFKLGCLTVHCFGNKPPE